MTIGSTPPQPYQPAEGRGGKAIYQEQQIDVDHWEIMGLNRQKEVRGWFACHGPSFSPPKTALLHLSLWTLQAERIEVDIEITVPFKAAELWEFRIVA